MRRTAIITFVALALAVVLVAPTGALAQTGDSTYRDAVTGVSFRAPSGLFVVPAREGVAGRTTQAIFSTYRGPDDPNVRVDLRRHLVITAYVATRMTGEDLRAWAARNAPGAKYTVSELPGRDGIVLDGLFQTGQRRYALIPKSPTLVLVVDAFPTSSSRIGMFDGILASLEVR